MTRRRPLSCPGRSPAGAVLAGTALALASAVAAPPTALACRRTVAPRNDQGQPCLFWAVRVLPVHIRSGGTTNVPGTAEFDAVRRSFATWSAVAGSDFTFVGAGLTTDPRVGYFPQGAVNANQVVWRTRYCSDVVPAGDDCWTAGGCGNRYDCWEQPRESIATTTTTFNNKCGELYDGDIELNDPGFFFTVVDSPPCPPGKPAATCVATDVENTVTHELGHLLGFDHCDLSDPACLETTMYLSAPQGETKKRTLEADDVKCLVETYPDGKPTSVCVACRGDSKGCGCGGASAAAMPWLAVFVAAAKAARARRRCHRADT